MYMYKQLLKSSLRGYAKPVICAPLQFRARPVSLVPIRSFASSSGLPTVQPRLRLGTEAPNFTAETTHGKIDFHEFIGDSWAILFSHPADFTPVCTTELGAFAKLLPEFTKRGVKLIGLSANGLGSHHKWIKDIDEVTGSGLSGDQSFPIIADAAREVAWLYDMVDGQDLKNTDKKGMPTDMRAGVVQRELIASRSRIYHPLRIHY